MKKTRWILVPLGTDEDKRLFERFIKENTGKEIKIGTQYRSGLVMQLVSPDLKRFSQTNITCGLCAFYRTRGINDFIERYVAIKAQENEIKTGFKVYVYIKTKQDEKKWKEFLGHYFPNHYASKILKQDLLSTKEHVNRLGVDPDGFGWLSQMIASLGTYLEVRGFEEFEKTYCFKQIVKNGVSYEEGNPSCERIPLNRI